MKKFILGFMILLSFALCGVSAFILTGCGETPSSESGEEIPDDDVEANATDIDLYIYVYEQTGYEKGDGTLASTSSSNIVAGSFDITSLDPDGGYGSMSETLNYVASSGKTAVKDGTKSVSNIQYVHYKASYPLKTYKRYMRVTTSSSASGWQCRGMSSYQGATLLNDSYDNSNFYIVNSDWQGPVPSSSSVTSTNKGTFYVVFKKAYTAYFYNNYSSSDNTTYTTQTFYAGERYYIAGSASRTGYTFNGWYSSRSGGTQYGTYEYRDSADCTSNHSYYAHWTVKRYLVTLDGNGATSNGTTSFYAEYGSSSKYTSSTGSSTVYFTRPSRTGYSLTEWTSVKNGSTRIMTIYGEYVTNASGYTSNGTWIMDSATTLYASWSLNSYYLYVYPNGGTFGSSAPSGWTKSGTTYCNQKFNYGTSIKTYLDQFTSTYLYKTGYSLSGWTLGSASGTAVDSSTTMPDEVAYAYAQWSPNTYTITLNANGGSGGSTSVAATYGSSTLGTITKPTRTYVNGSTYTTYNFAGWSFTRNGTDYLIDSSGAFVASKSYGGTAYTDSSRQYIATSGVTLYAKWTPVTRTITVNIYTSTTGSNTYTLSGAGGTVGLTYYTDSNNTSGGSSSPTITSATAYSSTSSSTLSVSSIVGYAGTLNYANASPTSGYYFMGFSSTVSTSFSSYTPTTNLSITGSSSNVTVAAYFKKAENEVYQKSDGYYYVDYGMFPKTYVASPGSLTSVGASITIAGKTCSIYRNSSSTTYYAYYNGKYYRFETITWRITSSGWSTKGAQRTSLTMVTDEIVFADAIVTNLSSITEGTKWSFTSSDLYSHVNTMMTNTYWQAATGITSGTVTASYDYFPSSSDSSGNKVLTESKSGSNLRVASVSELESVLGTSAGAKNAKLSQFAADILTASGKSSTTGARADYWTRDLGVYFKQGTIIPSNGTATSGGELNNIYGVRLAYTLSSVTWFGKTS